MTDDTLRSYAGRVVVTDAWREVLRQVAQAAIEARERVGVLEGALRALRTQHHPIGDQGRLRVCPFDDGEACQCGASRHNAAIDAVLAGTSHAASPDAFIRAALEKAADVLHDLPWGYEGDSNAEKEIRALAADPAAVRAIVEQAV